MDFYKDFPERSDAGTATTPDGAVVAGSDKLNDNDYALVGANGTGSNSQGKGYKVKFSSIYNYLKGKLLGDSDMVANRSKNGFITKELSARLFQSSVNSYENKQKWLKICTTKQSETNQDYVLVVNGFYDYGSGDSRNACLLTLSSRVYSSTLVTCVRIGRNNKPMIGWVDEQNGAISFYIKVASPNTMMSITCLSAPASEALSILPDRNWLFTEPSNIKYDKVEFIGYQDALAASYIAERYSADEEQALTRRMIANDPTVVEQFEAYNAYCEECKAKAKLELEKQAEEAQTE